MKLEELLMWGALGAATYVLYKKYQEQQLATVPNSTTDTKLPGAPATVVVQTTTPVMLPPTPAPTPAPAPVTIPLVPIKTSAEYMELATTIKQAAAAAGVPPPILPYLSPDPTTWITIVYPYKGGLLTRVPEGLYGVKSGGTPSDSSVTFAPVVGPIPPAWVPPDSSYWQRAMFSATDIYNAQTPVYHAADAGWNRSASRLWTIMHPYYVPSR